jgi:hypothetical protein
MRSACQCTRSASHQFSAFTLKRLHNCGSKLRPTHCACRTPLFIQGGQDCSRYEIKNITLNFENLGGNHGLYPPRQALSWEQNKINPGWASIENGQCAYFVSAIFAFLSQEQPRRMTPVTTRQGCQLGLFFPRAWRCRSDNAADQSKGATHCYGATVRCYSAAKAGGVVVPTLTIPKPSSRAVHPFRALGQRSPQTPPRLLFSLHAQLLPPSKPSQHLMTLRHVSKNSPNKSIGRRDMTSAV